MTQRASDDLTLGMLIARMDDMRADIQGLRADVRGVLGSLPQQYVPRAELDERRRTVDERQAGIERRIDGVTTGRRWAIGLTVPTLLSIAALANSAVHLAH
jgi:hypothetical protein